MLRRVVITGVGPVTAFGVGVDPLWRGMIDGRTAIRRHDGLAAAGMACPFVAALEESAFDVRKIVPKSYRKATKVMCRDIELAVAAAASAIADAGLTTRGTDADAEPTIAPHRMGCHIGAGLISPDIEELTSALVTSRTTDDDGHQVVDLADWGRAGMTNLTPLWLLKYLPNMLACHVTIIHDCRGPSNTITCCEASSALSLGESMRVIERGAADACLTGGAEEKLNPMSHLRQHFAGRLAAADGGADVESIVRPFADDATGTVLGEGGGLLVLEEAAHASARGARAYAEIAGFGAGQSIGREPAGLTIDPDDETLAATIEAAIADAGIGPGDIDAIVPFGSSIPTVDAAERAAIHRVLGNRAARVPLITTVPFVGNCSAGNGAVALAVAARAMREQTLPARLYTTGVSDLDANACPARPAELGCILVTTTSQGGQNAAVVLRKT